MESKTSKKKWIIIIAIIIITILLSGGITGYIVLKKQNEKSDEVESTEWGDKYISYIEKILDENPKINSSLKNAKSEINVNFVEVQEQENPVMILKYDTEVTDMNKNKSISKNTEIYYIDDNDNVKFSVYPDVNTKIDLEYLYNIEKDEYAWYITSSTEYQSNEKTYLNTSYEPLYIVVNAKKKLYSIDPIDNEELYRKTNQEVNEYENNNKYNFSNDNNIKSKKFDDVFIDINDLIEQTSYTYTVDMSLKEIRKLTNKFIQEAYKTNQKLTTADIQEKVASVKEEKQNTEQKENEVTQQTEQGLQVGNKIVKYGRYSGKVAAEGVTLTIKADGTAVETGRFGTINYTYSIGKDDFSQDLDHNYKDAILFDSHGKTLSGGFSLYVSANGDLIDGDADIYTYLGE